MEKQAGKPIITWILKTNLTYPVKPTATIKFKAILHYPYACFTSGKPT